MSHQDEWRTAGGSGEDRHLTVTRPWIDPGLRLIPIGRAIAFWVLRVPSQRQATRPVCRTQVENSIARFLRSHEVQDYMF
jgi:hypothetical protein